MDITIRPVKRKDSDRVYELAIKAWENVYIAFEEMLGSGIYHDIWPDWKASKKRSIEKRCCDDSPSMMFVAEYEGTIAGFVSYRPDSESGTGTIEYLAVDPDFQSRGIGTRLNEFAIDQLKRCGMRMVVAETGGDESHLPARKSYEKAGFRGMTLVRYFARFE